MGVRDFAPAIGSNFPESKLDSIVVATDVHLYAETDPVTGEDGPTSWVILTVGFYNIGSGQVGTFLHEWKELYRQQFNDLETAMSGKSERILYERDRKKPAPWLQGYLNCLEASQR